jgi:hypothetical protein
MRFSPARKRHTVMRQRALPRSASGRARETPSALGRDERLATTDEQDTVSHRWADVGTRERSGRSP